MLLRGLLAWIVEVGDLVEYADPDGHLRRRDEYHRPQERGGKRARYLVPHEIPPGLCALVRRRSFLGDD